MREPLSLDPLAQPLPKATTPAKCLHMLLSLSHKFIFIANLKSASSSIEAALGPYAEFRISKTQFGKHDTLSTISKKLFWVKRYVPLKEFFIFGVVREPVDFILSLYNFHTREGFSGKPHSSKGIPFDEFWNGWCVKSWQTRPQHARFTDSHGHFHVSHIIDYAQLSREFPKVCVHLGLKATLGKSNISPRVLSRRDLSEGQIAAIEERHADDYAFLENRPRAF